MAKRKRNASAVKRRTRIRKLKKTQSAHPIHISSQSQCDSSSENSDLPPFVDLPSAETVELDHSCQADKDKKQERPKLVKRSGVLASLKKQLLQSHRDPLVAGLDLLNNIRTLEKAIVESPDILLDKCYRKKTW